MKIIIDDEVLKKYNISFSQFIYLLRSSVDISDKEIEELSQKNLVSFYYKEGLPDKTRPYLFDDGIRLVDNIIADSSVNKSEKDRLYSLAYKMQKIYPEGKKPGTNFYWKGNTKEISNKLVKFIKTYDCYTDEQILEATKRYVNSYEHDRTLMKLLKYFILKKDKNDNEEISELASWLENLDKEGDIEIIKTSRLI